MPFREESASQGALKAETGSSGRRQRQSPACRNITPPALCRQLPWPSLGLGLCCQLNLGEAEQDGAHTPKGWNSRMGSLSSQLGVKFAQLKKKKKIPRSRPKKIPYHSGTASSAICHQRPRFPGQAPSNGAIRSPTLKVEEEMTSSSASPACSSSCTSG